MSAEKDIVRKLEKRIEALEEQLRALNPDEGWLAAKGLQVYDESENVVAELQAEEGEPALYLYDADGNTRACLGVEDGRGYLQVCAGGDSETELRVAVDADEAIALTVYDGDGDSRVRLAVADDGSSSLSLHGPHEHGIWLYGDAEGAAALHVGQAEDESGRIELSADGGSEVSVVLRDEEGNAQVLIDESGVYADAGEQGDSDSDVAEAESEESLRVQELMLEDAKQRVAQTVDPFARDDSPHVWWVNQGSCWSGERRESLVCSSAEAQQLKYRAMVGDVRKGDVIVHYVKGQIRAISQAEEDGHWMDEVPTNHSCWYGPGWMFRTNYKDLIPIERDEVAGRLVEIAEKDGPVLASGRVRQAYFMPFTPEGLGVIHRVSREQWPDWATALLASE